MLGASDTGLRMFETGIIVNSRLPSRQNLGKTNMRGHQMTCKRNLCKRISQFRVSWVLEKYKGSIQPS